MRPASACFIAWIPASLKAISEESTAWYRAVEQAHPHALDGIAREHAGLPSLRHALLHRRDERAGDHPALDVVDELEARGGSRRLDLDLAVAELAASARLLLVAAVALARARIVSR